MDCFDLCRCLFGRRHLRGSKRMETHSLESKLQILCREAMALGCSRVRIVGTDLLVVREAARAKCYVPLCRFFGSSLMCPPHNPLTPEVTRKIIQEYSFALLFQLEARVEDFVGPDWRSTHLPTELRHKEILAELEARAFYMGFPLAMGFGAGECSLCLPSRPCSALRGEPCAHSLKARPAMEACGFDVFAIVEKVGWPMVPIGHRSRKEDVPCASLVGLVLIT